MGEGGYAIPNIQVTGSNEQSVKAQKTSNKATGYHEDHSSKTKIKKQINHFHSAPKKSVEGEESQSSDSSEMLIEEISSLAIDLPKNPLMPWPHEIPLIPPCERSFTVGESNFRNMMEKCGQFIDKSLFIKEVIDDKSVVKLILRPRRFGKTLNMSMLESFFSNQCRSDKQYFESLKIWQSGEKYTAQQGKYPVIFLTFKDIKEETYEKALTKFKNEISKKYKEYKKLISKVLKDKDEKILYKKIIDKSADEPEIEDSLRKLTEYFHQQYKTRVIILIDEYDTSINASFHNGYYQNMVDFMRSFLSPALKDNKYLEQAVITGILRVSKESIFSGLNNIKVYSVLSEKYSKYFGFSLEEIKKIISYQTNAEQLLYDIECWYGGYRIGEQILYNPWSIVNFLEDNSEKVKDGFKNYWINTADDKLITDLLDQPSIFENIKEEFKKLFQGQSIIHKIDEHTVFNSIKQNIEAIWSFLLLYGYLTNSQVKEEKNNGNQNYEVTLKIPNNEVFNYYRNIIKQWYPNDTLDYRFKPNFILGMKEIYLKSISNFNSEERKNAVNALSQLCKIDNTLFEQVKTKLTRGTTVEERRSAAKILKKMRISDDGIVEVLIEGLKDENSSVRANVIKALERLDKMRDEKVIKAHLKNLSDDVYCGVRQGAAEALMQLKVEVNKVIKVLIKNLKDNDDGVRQRAAIELGKAGESDYDDIVQVFTNNDMLNNIIRELQHALTDKNLLVKLSATEALKKIAANKKQILTVSIYNTVVHQPVPVPIVFSSASNESKSEEKELEKKNENRLFI